MFHDTFGLKLIIRSSPQSRSLDYFIIFIQFSVFSKPILNHVVRNLVNWSFTAKIISLQRTSCHFDRKSFEAFQLLLISARNIVYCSTDFSVIHLWFKWSNFALNLSGLKYILNLQAIILFPIVFWKNKLFFRLIVHFN